VFSSNQLLAQNIKDSLLHIIKDKNEEDTTRLKSLSELIKKVYLYSNQDSAYKYAKVQYDFAKKIGSLLYQSAALNWMGASFTIKGDYPKALDFFERSLKCGDNVNTANVLNNIGLIYMYQNELEKANQYFSKSLKILEKGNNQESIAFVTGNLGLIYSNLGEQENAIIYLEKSLAIHKSLKNTPGIAHTLNNLGVSYMNLKDFNQALAYLAEANEVASKNENTHIELYSNLNIGDILFQQKKLTKAKLVLEQTLQKANEEDNYEILNKSAALLVKIYKEELNYQKAFSRLELFLESKDSLQKTENAKALLELEYKLKNATDSIKNAEFQKIKNAELDAEKAKSTSLQLEGKQKKQQNYFLISGLLISLLLGGLIFNRFRLTKTQKQVIEKQKVKVDEAFKELEEKNKSITDSINYAKRIQNAILPSERDIKNLLPNSFILYKPKDIVAGDFYWIGKKYDVTFVAVADCTGHGVPGAMVSVVCNNALNKVFRESDKELTGLILDEVNALVIEQFSKNESEVSDGMDIALCAIDFKKQQLNYSGANIPIFIVRAGELIVLNPDRQPIGRYFEMKSFNTRIFELQENDTIYLSTDGFADQFGGQAGKKMKSKAYKILLTSLAQQPIEKQIDVLNQAFVDWQGKNEQVDDVCVMGIHVKSISASTI